MDGRLRLVRDLDPARDASSGAPLHELGDDDLMKLVAQRVRDAFRTLVTRYQTRVISICTRSMGSPDEGRETAQEVFVALWQAAPTYDPRGNFPGYLFTLVRNRLRSVARRRLTSDATVLALAGEGESVAPDQLQRLLAAEDERRLRLALADLSETHRHALLLRFTAELPYEDIAGMCGAPVGTVRSWVHHGIKKLREALGEMS